MNIEMIQPRNETEELLLVTKNCEIFIKQTHTEPQETLEFKLIKPREAFAFRPFNILVSILTG